MPSHKGDRYGDGAGNALYGEGGDDIINGGGGNDYLHGGRCYDVLTGGEGADQFIFSNIDTVQHEMGNHIPSLWATVTDFNVGQGDRINLKGFMDLGSVPGPTACIGGGAFTGTQQNPGIGQVRLTGGGGGTTVHMDIDGDGTEDGSIFLQGLTGFMKPGEDAFLLSH